jgi:hypothetical protein
MELHIEDQTVEPSLSRAPLRRPVARLKWADVKTRLEGCAIGRMVLDAVRWAVVIALITTGFFTAAGIDTGVTALRNANPGDAQQMLAASTARK